MQHGSVGLAEKPATKRSQQVAQSDLLSSGSLADHLGLGSCAVTCLGQTPDLSESFNERATNKT